MTKTMSPHESSRLRHRQCTVAWVMREPRRPGWPERSRLLKQRPDGGERMSEKEKAEFARRFVEAFKESSEMQQMVLDFICRCPSVKIEI